MSRFDTKRGTLCYEIVGIENSTEYKIGQWLSEKEAGELCAARHWRVTIK